MTRPSNPAIKHTPAALTAKIEGVLIVRCTITSSGGLQNCKIIKGLPHMDNVVQQMQGQRVTPMFRIACAEKGWHLLQAPAGAPEADSASWRAGSN